MWRSDRVKRARAKKNERNACEGLIAGKTNCDALVSHQLKQPRFPSTGVIEKAAKSAEMLSVLEKNEDIVDQGWEPISQSMLSAQAASNRAETLATGAVPAHWQPYKAERIR